MIKLAYKLAVPSTYLKAARANTSCKMCSTSQIKQLHTLQGGGFLLQIKLVTRAFWEYAKNNYLHSCYKVWIGVISKENKVATLTDDLHSCYA